MLRTSLRMESSRAIPEELEFLSSNAQDFIEERAISGRRSAPTIPEQ